MATGTPLAKKLGIKSGHTVGLIAAPDGWAICDLPPDVAIVADSGEEPFDVAIVFVRSMDEVTGYVPALRSLITREGGVWVAWPRRAGGHRSDVTDVSVRDAILPTGLVDIKVAALDEDWSALKFVLRKELR